MIKAVFFDIDGTLISFRTHTVPLATRKALAELRRRGIKCFVATGRPGAQIDNLEGIHFDGMVTLNGACCLGPNGEVIHKAPLHREDIEALVHCQQQDPFPCILVGERNISINYVDERVEELARFVAVPPPPVREMQKASREEILQATVYVDAAREEALLRTVFCHGQTNRWHPSFADVNAAGVSKASGIDRMLAHYGLSLAESMAFGDGGNDIPMLRHVGTGIAMGNASESVKQQADYVTDTVDEEGIPNALRHFGLIG